jgi:hypothetical protein
MALQSYEVGYSLTGSSWTALTNVQDIQLTIGRQQQLDQVKASTGSVSMRYPTGYASPIADLVSGTYIRVRNNTNPASPYDIWYGRINDVVAEYGIPYAGGVGPSDYLQITVEGTFSALGRMQGEGYSMTANTIVNQMTAATTETGLNLSYLENVTTRSLGATTISGTWADWIGRVCQSTNSRLWDGISLFGCQVIDPFYNVTSTFAFSDVANNATNQVYNQINFDSIANNFYTQVTVTPESFAEQTVTAAGATPPLRTYQTNTVNASGAQAADYGNYLLNNYSNPKLGISSITCSGEAQNTFGLDKIGFADTFFRTPGTQVSVTFRGTVYPCIIEGVNMSASPAGCSFTYYLSDADLNAYLILDNVAFGKLDENRLGY